MSLAVVAHRNAAGDVSLGVEENGVFVPFVTFSKGKYAQFVERHLNLQKRGEAGDEGARDVLGSAFKEPKSRSKGAAEPGEGS